MLTAAMMVLMMTGAAEHIRRVRDTHDDDGARDDIAGDAHGNGGNGNDVPHDGSDHIGDSAIGSNIQVWR